jgi:hypothetical protein
MRAFHCLPLLATLALMVTASAQPPSPLARLEDEAWQKFMAGDLRGARDALIGASDGGGTAAGELHWTLAAAWTRTLGDWPRLVGALQAAEPKCQDPALADRMRVLLLEGAQASGDVDGTLAATRRAGCLHDWWLIGPFDNERGAGFQRELPPEKGVRLDAEVEGKKRPVRWRRLPVRAAPGGRVDVDALVRPNDQVLCYFTTVLHARQATDALLRLGCEESFVVWLNGTRLQAADLRRPFAYDQNAVTLPLQPGPNLLLLKLCEQEGDYSFAARLTATDGAPLADRVTERSEPEDIAAAAAQQPRSTAQPGREPGMLAAWDQPSADRRERMRMAWLLHLRRADDFNDRRDRRLAAELVASSPADALTRFLLAETRLRPLQHQAEKEDNARRHDYEAVLALDPEFVPALLALARLDLESVGAAGRCEQLCLRALRKAPASWQARCLRAKALRQLRLDVLALRELEQAKAACTPLAPELAQELAGALESAGDVDGACQALAAAARADFSAPRVERHLQAAWRAGRTEDAARVLQDAQRLLPFAASLHRGAARHAEARGQLAEAMTRWQAWLALCPEDDAGWVDLARVRGRLDDADGERDALRQALSLNPNLKDSRRLLEFLESDQRPFYQPYELDGDAVVAADPGPPADAAAANDATWHVLSQRVVTAYRGGTTGEYRHSITRVLTDEGARRLDTYAVRHWPGEQRARLLSVRVVKKDGQVQRPRLRGEYVDLPPLAPGDLVEIRERVDDLQPTFFGDMFGLEHLFVPEDGSPCGRAELVLVLEPGRDYRVQHKNGAPPPERSVDAGQRTVLRCAMRSLPRRPLEERRPEAEELEPLVRVTTYRDWQEFGAWWWNLIRKQIEVSPAIRSKVQELTVGLTSEQQKIAALHRFVTTGVRYTAWEFGVHGYKPYSTPAIYDRRHGDCKDKALLLNAMLGEIGIEAWPVLIHADDPRRVDDLELPMVGHFNHCISYLPPADGRGELYLDGTAIYHDPATLPAMDQGAQVLVVRDQGSELKAIPYAPAEANVDQREATLVLEPDGDARITDEHRPVRNHAVRVREELGNERELRKEKLERELGQRYGQVRIEDIQTSDLLDLGQPVVVRVALQATGVLPPQNDVIRLKATFEPSPLLPLARAERRATPLLLGIPGTQRARLTYEVPPDWTIDGLPAPALLQSRFGALHVVWTQTGRQVQVERELVLSSTRVEPQEYGEFRAFAQAVEEADRRTAPVRKGNGR